MKMTSGSDRFVDLIISYTDGGLKCLKTSGVAKLLPKTNDKQKDGKVTKIFYKIKYNQAPYIAMWHGSEAFGISIELNIDGTPKTETRVQITDECIEKLSLLLFLREKSGDITEERKKVWLRQLTINNLVFYTFDKWSCFVVCSAFVVMNWSPKIIITFLDKLSQIKGNISFEECESIFNKVNFGNKLKATEEYDRYLHI